MCVVGVFRASPPDPLRRTPLRRTPLRGTPPPPDRPKFRSLFSPAGVSHDNPRAQTCTFERTCLPKHHQNSTKKTKREGKMIKKLWREREEKARNFGPPPVGPPPFKPPPFGAPPFAAPPFGAPPFRGPHPFGAPLFLGFGPPTHRGSTLRGGKTLKH